jgi:hypothetical protein
MLANRRSFGKIELVQLLQIVLVVVSVDLLFIDDALGDRLLRHLSLVDLFLHRSQRQEAVNVARLRLPEPIDTEDALNVVRGIPGDVEDDHAIGSDQVDSETAGTRRDEEETSARVRWAVEVLALLHRRGSVEAEVILTETPRADERSGGIVLLGALVDVVEEVLDDVERVERLREDQAGNGRLVNASSLQPPKNTHSLSPMASHSSRIDISIVSLLECSMLFRSSSRQNCRRNWKTRANVSCKSTKLISNLISLSAAIARVRRGNTGPFPFFFFFLPSSELMLTASSSKTSMKSSESSDFKSFFRAGLCRCRLK